MVAKNTVNAAALARVNARVRQIQSETEAMSGFALTVGIHEEEGSEVDDDAGATIATIAAVHEFGNSTVPRRSWLLDWISENESELAEAFRRSAREVAARRLTARVAWEQIGEFSVAGIQRRIRGNIGPPLSPETVARKGSSVALIDEGRMIASIRAKVRTDL